ncbi:bacteriocin fulvocin C-related protein [Prevotella sp. 10(H)]|uniref:bacteriocin fulvocin C-related protein n=1 Tax=Prevotella sp. 10(H) TaxID=1158294 RepID=UPI0004A740CA|nr:bacteriocin fulvocin C-related protein [Prevotella sp. 10(H)]
MKVKLLSILLVLCGLGLFSCSGDDEYYSCDPEANEWAKDNLDDIRKMTRSEWLNVDVGLQRAAYVAFVPDQKKNFWMQKMDEALKLNWNEKEKAHLKEIQNYLSRNINFSTETTKEENIFIYKWIEYAREELGWTDKIIYALIFDGRFLINTEGDLKVDFQKTTTLKTMGEQDCDCNYDAVFTKCSNMIGFKCYKGGLDPKNPCREKKKGCGAFWNSPCDGECYPG